ncbi:VOC family protein [bacterium]|nr:VOC family protein [bacterium]
MRKHTLYIVAVLLLLFVGVNFGIINPLKKENVCNDNLSNYEKLGEVRHLGWVVSDIHKTAEYWEKIGLPKIKIRENVHLHRGVYRGKQMDAYVHSGWTELEGMGIEFFQPVKGESAFSEFLTKHGEGIHHLAFEMNSHEELEKEVTRWKDMGVGVQAEGSWETQYGKARFVYMDTEPAGGLVFELGYFPRAKNNKKESSSLKSRFPYGSISVIAVNVRDVDKVSIFYEKLGFEFRISDKKGEGLLRRYKGKERDIRYNSAWFSLGGINLKILQTTKDWNVYNDLIKKHGEGVPHLGFVVEDIDEAKDYAERIGINVIQDGAWGNPGDIKGRFVCLNTEPVGGVNIELLCPNR